MNLIGILLYTMIGFGALFVVAAVLVLVFLFFEDFWRRLFRLEKNAPAAETKDKTTKNKDKHVAN
jgi:Na+-transporting methylmalonyl-CoA/oxaloacetate decarboxylase gamma subunit